MPSPSPKSKVGSPAQQQLAARAQIEFELKFFAAILEQRPDYQEVLKEHAKNLAIAQRHVEGLECDRRLAKLRPTDSLVRYNLACSLSLTQHKDEALAVLREAVELGYRDFEFIRHDRDLDFIRKDPRFKQILSDYERRR